MNLKKGIMAMLVAGMVLTGCSSNTEQKTTTCKGTDTDLEKVIFVSEGDKVITQTEYYPTSYVDLGITEEDAADQEYWDSVAKQYQDGSGLSKGLTVKVENDTEAKAMVLIFELNYVEADLKELEKIGLVDNTESNYISLAKTIENFEETESVICE